MEIKEQYRKKLEEELKYATDGLESIINDSPENLPKVYEEDFVKYLLPYILGLVSKDDETNSKAFFNNWMKLVGDIVLPFYVVDDNGNTLFKVPRYLAKFDDEHTIISDVSYITILKEFKAEYERFPEKAQYELNRTIETLANMFKLDKESVKEVYEFYSLVRSRYDSFYKEYRANLIKSELSIIDNKISEIKSSEDFDGQSEELDALIKEKEKLIKELESLGETFEEAVEETEDSIYNNIEYED